MSQDYLFLIFFFERLAIPALEDELVDITLKGLEELVLFLDLSV
jgi:hypothetical protein